MGKKAKKFIAKGEGQHFFVLRRSQRDEAHAGDEKPSDFVLVPSNQTSQSAVPKRSIFSNPQIQDHITPLGFANDGYDYSQHLKPMGGGVFVGKDGHRTNASSLPTSKEVILPADSLPSEQELERNLQAITISQELMDEDIRDALFDDDEEGNFETLDDDFVNQAMEEPAMEEGAAAEFDFDAHIKWLIEQSERALNPAPKRGARGWDTVGTGGQWLPRRIRGSDDNELHRRIAEDDEDEEFSSDIDEDDDEEDESEEEDEQKGSRRGVKYDAIDDEEFDKLAEEYDDEQLGDLEGDSDVEGIIDITHADAEGLQDQLLEEILNDHIQSQHDIAYETGVKPSANKLVLDDDHSGDADITSEVIKAGFREQMILQAVLALPQSVLDNSSSSAVKVGLKSGTKFINVDEVLPKKMGMLELIDVGEVPDESLLVCQEYLREVAIRDEWDCESVLSTYSTTDNHPSLIKEYGSRLQKQNRNPAPNSGLSGNGIRVTNKQSISATGRNSIPVEKIVLKGKYSLPSEFIAANQRNVSSSTDEAATVDAVTAVRSRSETAEEKKKRKSEVKEARKSRRQEKKLSKETEKSITLKQNTCSSSSAVNLDHVSVFKYSS